MALGKHLIQAVPFVYGFQCPTGKFDNNTGRIPALAGLSNLTTMFGAWPVSR